MICRKGDDDSGRGDGARRAGDFNGDQLTVHAESYQVVCYRPLDIDVDESWYTARK